jgi:hypothetical protein
MVAGAIVAAGHRNRQADVIRPDEILTQGSTFGVLITGRSG